MSINHRQFNPDESPFPPNDIVVVVGSTLNFLQGWVWVECGWVGPRVPDRLGNNLKGVGVGFGTSVYCLVVSVVLDSSA